MKISAYSLAFVKPIYQAIKKEKVVIIRAIYSRCSGNNELFIAERISQVKNILRELPREAAVQWIAIDDPEFDRNKYGIVPTFGEVISGIY